MFEFFLNIIDYHKDLNVLSETITINCSLSRIKRRFSELWSSSHASRKRINCFCESKTIDNYDVNRLFCLKNIFREKSLLRRVKKVLNLIRCYTKLIEIIKRSYRNSKRCFDKKLSYFNNKKLISERNKSEIKKNCHKKSWTFEER